MILAVLQARTGSTRLPGKVLMPILGQPMLLRQIERLRRCKTLDNLVVATSSDASDDTLAATCEAAGVAVGRGSRDDVLDRFIQVARPYEPDAVVRLTGDCPLADPDVIDNVVAAFSAGDCDYCSNIDPPTFPDGLDAEVISFAALERAHREATLQSEREHVTLFVRNHRELFRQKSYRSHVDFSSLRWTVDELSDFEFVRAVYERLYPTNPMFGMSDILALLEHEPELTSINTGIARNEGLEKSLASDRKIDRK